MSSFGTPGGRGDARFHGASGMGSGKGEEALEADDGAVAQLDLDGAADAGARTCRGAQHPVHALGVAAVTAAALDGRGETAHLAAVLDLAGPGGGGEAHDSRRAVERA